MRVGIILPTVGHGGAEYSALTVGKALQEQYGCTVQVAVPEVEGTRILRDALADSRLERIGFNFELRHNDDENTFTKLRFATREHFIRDRFDAVFVPYPWFKRGLGIIPGLMQADVATVVKFALLPEGFSFPPFATPWLRQAAQARQLWFTNSRHNSDVLAGALGVAKSTIDFFHVGPVGMMRLMEQQRPPTNLRQELGLPASAVLVTTVARVSEQKGYDILLEAAKAVLADHEDVYFVWVGHVDKFPQFRDSVQQAGLGGRVHMLGHRADVRRILRESSLFVLPTLYEGGCSQALLEALDEEVPAVVSDIPGVKEVVTDGENAVLFESGSVESLAARIRYALDRRDELSELIAKGKATAAIYTADRMIRNTYLRLRAVRYRGCSTHATGIVNGHQNTRLSGQEGE